MKFAKAAACVLALGYASAANAIVVDGAYDTDYGSATSTVYFNETAPQSNFDTPRNTNHATEYSIYLKEQGGSVYGLLLATEKTGLNFANLYFDLNRATSLGSDLGFEITNNRAFVPGAPGYSGPLSGLTFALSADGKGLEFSISDTYFTSAIPGLSYSGQPFTAPGLEP